MSLWRLTIFFSLWYLSWYSISDIKCTLCLHLKFNSDPEIITAENSSILNRHLGRGSKNGLMKALIDWLDVELKPL